MISGFAYDSSQLCVELVNGYLDGRLHNVFGWEAPSTSQVVQRSQFQSFKISVSSLLIPSESRCKKELAAIVAPPEKGGSFDDVHGSMTKGR